MMLYEAHHTILLRCDNELLVVLEKLHGRLRDKHVQATLNGIECNWMVSA